jgi:predicted AlkP superfamily pyrophosphatase or phosphodiesterase
VKAAIIAEQLGMDNITDFLAVSYSSPDYIGHTFGPNSIEQEDDFLRLDKELGGLLDFLDSKVGKNQYTVFLSADHGVAHIPDFLKENRIPAGRTDGYATVRTLNLSLKEKYKVDRLIASVDNYQLALNNRAIDSAQLNKEEIMNWIIKSLTADPAIARAFPIARLSETTLNEKLKSMLTNGYFPRRSGDIQFVLQSNFIEWSSPTGTTHGLWNPYDSHIPLVWYGWGIKQGKSNREVYMTDIAPTLAALLKIQAPSGSIGKVVEEVLK